MGAVWYRGRRELRRRAAAVLLLVVVLGTAGGAVLAAVAGARRTASAFDRFVTYARPGDVFVGSEHGLTPDFVDGVNHLPQIERVVHYWQPALGYEDPSLFDIALVPLDDPSGTAVNRPLMVSGRPPAGVAPYEVALSERSARRLHVAVGDPLPMQGYDEADLARSTEGGGPVADPEGPRITLRVAGIYRGPEDVLARPGDISVLFFSPAFAAVHRGRDIASFGESLSVRLRGGPRDVEAFLAALHRLPDANAVSVDSASTSSSGGGAVQTTTGTAAGALTAFAAALAAALLVALGAALVRLAGLVTAEQPVLAAVGFNRRQRAAGLLLPGAVVAAAGTALALAVAVAASPLFPIGVGRRAEIHPGLAVDGPALALGGLVMAAAVLVSAALAAWRAGGPDRSGAAARPRWSDGLAGWAAGRPPLATAARIGLGAGRGAAGAPVRPALAGAVAGVVGVVATLTFGAGLGHLLGTPRLYGAPWSADRPQPAAVRRLVAGGVDISIPAPPPEVSRLDDVRAVPNLLAVFLAVLGAAAVAGGLASVVARRRRELAVLRTLGFTPAQTRRSVLGAGLLQAGLALALGLPLGITLGRVVWGRVAESLGVQPAAVVPGSVVVVLLATPLFALAIASLPARRAARLRPALVLRAE